MRRISVCAPTALTLVVGAATLTIATEAIAASQLLDPGWQIGIAAQPRGGNGGGIIQYMFSDGAGGAAIAYQPAPLPAPLYYRPAPQPRVVYQAMPQPRLVYQPAPAYYRMAPPARAYQPTVTSYQPAPAYYRMAPLARAYRPAVTSYPSAPVYYRQAAVPKPSNHQPGTGYYQQAPAAPRSSQVAPQPAASEPAPAPRATPPQPAPQYTGSVQQQQAAAQVAPGSSFFQLPPASQPSAVPPQSSAVQPAPAPQRSFFQLTPAPQSPTQEAFAPPPRSFFQLTPPPVAAPPGYAPSEYGDMAYPILDPKYERQVVEYQTDEPVGTIVVDTAHYFLYLVMGGGQAMRYGIGVGREGFTWSGTNEITAKREWPDWRPPSEMLERRPDLPRYMAGGIDNPLGARALYIGSTEYRIHGSNEPWTIGTRVSSGCIRLRNSDIIDLYGRVKVGAKVVVL